MPTPCRRDRFGYEGVEGRRVVAAFDGGQMTSAAGALRLGATDRAIDDQLRHDPVLAALTGKLEAKRTNCAPLAGKSLEPARARALGTLAFPQDWP